MAYDSAAISQKGCKAKTNFRYLDFSSIPRAGAETIETVRWNLLPKDIAEVRNLINQFLTSSNQKIELHHPLPLTLALGSISDGMF
jgi:hypothetical protein